jgi:hypothetical protein
MPHYPNAHEIAGVFGEQNGMVGESGAGRYLARGRPRR